MKSIGRHWPASDVPGTPNGSISRNRSVLSGCQPAGHFEDATQNFLSMQRLLTEQQEFMQRHAETVQSLDAEFMSHEQQQMQLERHLAELAGALKALKQEQQAQDRCVKSFQESLDSCRSSSLQCFKRVEEQQAKLEEIRADGQDCTARVEEHEVRLGVARSKTETQEQRLEWLGNRLEQQGEQIISQVDRHCNQALQKLRNELRSELIAWCGDAFVQFRAEVAQAERFDHSRQPEVQAAQRGLSEDMLAAVQRGMVAAQRSISEVKESLLMVLDGHSGARREVEELRLSIKLIADRVSKQEAAVSSVQKDMDQVCSSLQERIDKAETSSQRVTGLFQELRKDMARLLTEEPPPVDSANLEVLEEQDRQRSTSDLSQETVSQSCFRPWSRRFETADVDKVGSAPSEQHQGSGNEAENSVDAAVGSSRVEKPSAETKMDPPKSEWPADGPPSVADGPPSVASSSSAKTSSCQASPELPEVEKVEGANSEPANFAAPVIKVEDEAQSVSSSSSQSKDGDVQEKPALQAAQNKGASNGRRRSFELTLVDSDGEYDDDEFEDDDDPIEIKSSRRSSLKSQE